MCKKCGHDTDDNVCPCKTMMPLYTIQESPDQPVKTYYYVKCHRCNRDVTSKGEIGLSPVDAIGRYQLICRRCAQGSKIPDFSLVTEPINNVERNYVIGGKRVQVTGRTHTIKPLLDGGQKSMYKNPRRPNGDKFCGGVGCVSETKVTYETIDPEAPFKNILRKRNL